MPNIVVYMPNISIYTFPFQYTTTIKHHNKRRCYVASSLQTDFINFIIIVHVLTFTNIITV